MATPHQAMIPHRKAMALPSIFSRHGYFNHIFTLIPLPVDQECFFSIREHYPSPRVKESPKRIFPETITIHDPPKMTCKK